MTSNDPDPGSPPDQTADEQDETDLPETDSDGVLSSRRGVLATLAAVGGLGLTSNTVTAQTTAIEVEIVDVNTGGTPLQVRLNGERVLRLEPTPARAGANIIAGLPTNSVESGVEGATISGGGFNGDGSNSLPNEVSGDFGTIGGGAGNSATGQSATIGGGQGNDAGFAATVGGGANNAANFRGTIGGGVNNDVTGDTATVGGGDDNTASGNSSTVGGGDGNTASGESSSVGGGVRNSATGSNATVGGGNINQATRQDATVGGGVNNLATNQRATIGGGAANRATGMSATAPGGQFNIASGAYSFAAGRRARTRSSGGTTHDGAVVFGDSSDTVAFSQGPDTFTAQMPMFAPSFNTTSARAKKEAIEPVDTDAVLDTVTDIEVSTWEFKHDGEGRHMGPMAGEFADAFGLGADDESIATVDADGVALAGIQSLAERLDERDAELAEKTERLQAVEAENETLRTENEALRDRCEAVESRLADLEKTVADLAN